MRRLAVLTVALAACGDAAGTGAGGADAPAPDVAADVDSVGPGQDAGGGGADAAPGDAGEDSHAPAPDAADASTTPDATADSADAHHGPALEGPFPYPLLSDYRLFAGDPAQQQPAPGVLPYEVAAPLWSDNAAKHRFVVLPPGQKAAPHEADVWELPVGTILVKTFGFHADVRDPGSAERLVETRLLIREQGPGGPEWTAHVYLWDDAQADAGLHSGGAIVPVAYTDRSGAPLQTPYVVPNTNQCIDCHALEKEARPIGITTRQLARQVTRAGGAVDQLAWLVEQGALDAVPEGEALVDPYGSGPLEARARSWLDANCSHCHREGGEGGPSGLVLLASEQDPTSYGVCKPPVAAGPGTGGKLHDIVPGDPDASILVYRISSTDPAAKMPEIPNLLVDEPGVELIRAWIAAMPPQKCGPPGP